MKTADAIVVGGGIYGTLCLHQISRHFKRVLLLEASRRLAAGPTRYSGAVTRCHYPNIFMSQMAFSAIRDAWRVWRDYLEYPKARAEHKGCGVVLIPCPLGSRAPVGRFHGGRGELEYFANILGRARVPGIEFVDSRDFLWDNEGFWFDRERIPRILLETYSGYVSEPGIAAVDAARAACSNHQGARILLRTPVRRLSRSTTWKLETNRGTFETPFLVLAAGAATGRLLETAGLEARRHKLKETRPAVALPRRQKYFGEFHVGVSLEHQVYFRQRGRQIFVGSMVPEKTSRSKPSEHISVLEYQRRVRRLSGVCVGHDVRSPIAGFTTSYDENTFDHHPVIDELAPGLFVAWLFSGHGFKFAPVIARELAVWIATGHKPAMLEPLRADRPPIVPET